LTYKLTGITNFYPFLLYLKSCSVLTVTLPFRRAPWRCESR